MLFFVKQNNKKVAWVRKPRKREPGKMIKGSRENQKKPFFEKANFLFNKSLEKLEKNLEIMKLEFLNSLGRFSVTSMENYQKF